MGSGRKKFILGKLGLDAHDNGLRIVAKWLVGAGYEVVYAGLYNSPQRIVQMAIEENADAIGISFLGCEHLFYTDKLFDELRKNDLEHVKVVIGGVIPPDDVAKLKSLGVDTVFTTGTRKAPILNDLQSLFE
jgi:methylmalonyl-CoA mutase C-terminal domain/subunit